MNIALIGYRGTGKTSVGLRVADRLAWSFVDADQQLVERAGRTIKEIFAEHGEDYFRDLETDVLRELVTRERTVLSLGGGVILRDENRELLKSCRTVWLTATAETIEQRIATDPSSAEQRPNLTTSGGLEEVRRMLTTRQSRYESSASFQVTTDDRSIESIVDEVVRVLDIRAE